MTAQPTWSTVDDDTADLLTLVADEGHVSADYEWDYYVNALENCGALDGLIYPNQLRKHVRGYVAPRRIGAFTHRALSQGLVEYTGEWEVSDDTEGRNGGKPARIMRWLGEAATCKACHGKGSRLHGLAICPKACEDCGGTGEVRS